MWNKAIKVRRTVDAAPHFFIGGICYSSFCWYRCFKGYKHDCFIVNSNGEILADVFTIPNKHGWLPLPVAENLGLHKLSGQNKSRA